MEKKRGYKALRRGRVSIPGARYFLTFVTESRKRGLTRAFPVLVEDLKNFTEDSDGKGFAMVVMPNHLHLLFQLGMDKSLSAVFRTMKGRSSVYLRKFGLKWQKGAFHDHRLREDEALFPFIQYMLLNPYEAALVDWDTPWPYFWWSDSLNEQFFGLTNNGCPLKAWAQESGVRKVQAYDFE